MKARRDDEDAGDDGPDCYFCGQPSPGDFFDFYAGFCVDYQRTRAFLSNTVRIRATYRDLGRYSVLVCDDCAARTRLKRNLPGLLGWGLAALGCGIGALVAFITNAAGDQNIYLQGVCGLFGGLAGLLAALEGSHLVVPGTSPAVTMTVLEWVKKDPVWMKKGDSFFGPEEYRHLFKDSGETPMSADEILARDRTGSRGPKKRKPKPRKAQDTQPCPFCGVAIPSYAQACPHCKKILA